MYSEEGDSGTLLGRQILKPLRGFGQKGFRKKGFRFCLPGKSWARILQIMFSGAGARPEKCFRKWVPGSPCSLYSLQHGTAQHCTAQRNISDVAGWGWTAVHRGTMPDWAHCWVSAAPVEQHRCSYTLSLDMKIKVGLKIKVKVKNKD